MLPTLTARHIATRHTPSSSGGRDSHGYCCCKFLISDISQKHGGLSMTVTYRVAPFKSRAGRSSANTSST